MPVKPKDKQRTEKVLGGSDKYTAVIEPGSSVDSRQKQIKRGRLIQVAVGSVTAFADMQKRAAFDPQKNIEDARLVESVKEYGVIQPIAVVKPDDKTIQLIYGHRRYAAAERAGLKSVPALLHPAGTERFVLDVQTAIENFHRSDLNPIEQAGVVQAFKQKYGYSQREIAKILLMSPTQVNMLFALLDAPEEIVELLVKGEIGVRNAYEIIKMPKSNQHQAIGAIRSGMNAANVFAELEKSTVSNNSKKSKVNKNHDAINGAPEVLAALIGKNKNSFTRSLAIFGEDRVDETTRLLVASIASAMNMEFDQAAVFVDQQMSRQFRKEAKKVSNLMTRMRGYFSLIEPDKVSSVFLALSTTADTLAKQGGK